MGDWPPKITQAQYDEMAKGDPAHGPLEMRYLKEHETILEGVAVSLVDPASLKRPVILEKMEERYLRWHASMKNKIAVEELKRRAKKR